MNKHILEKAVQEYLRQHSSDNVIDIALHKSPFKEVTAAELAMQIDGKKRCSKKLPLWAESENIYFPPKLNIEQASSESTALYKSNLIRGKRIIDLTGGFGVDSFYFSARAEELVYVEQNEDLTEIAKHNLHILGATNIVYIAGNSLDFLVNAPADHFDTIYIDPARRIQTRKVFLLADTEPNVVEILDLLLKKGSRIIIKTSPLFDIRSGLKELSHVSEVHIVSVKNECKELLWVIDRDFKGEPLIIACAIGSTNMKTFKFTYASERETTLQFFSSPSAYLYEPDASLLKAGCFKLIATSNNLEKLHPNTHLYTSQTLNAGFNGRVFRVTDVLEYKDFTKKGKGAKANILTRNFPHTVDMLKKKHKLQDGGNRYLIFCTAPSGDLIVIEAERITDTKKAPERGPD